MYVSDFKNPAPYARNPFNLAPEGILNFYWSFGAGKCLTIWLDELNSSGILEKPELLKTADSPKLRTFMKATLNAICEGHRDGLSTEKIIKSMKNDVIFKNIDKQITNSLIDKTAEIYRDPNLA